MTDVFSPTAPDVTGDVEDVFAPTSILIPTESCDLTRWAVIAADQFTSDLDYWRRVDDFVGDAPSSLRMIVPEAFLQVDSDTTIRERTASAVAAMDEYRQSSLRALPRGVMVVERDTAFVTQRRSLLCALDLDAYDFTDTGSEVRASEATVLERIPARQAVRREAPLELPHAQVLFDDPDNTVMAILDEVTTTTPLYDTELMFSGGRVRGWHIADDQPEWIRVRHALSCLDASRGFRFIVGDGNHSLAAAKQHWEALRASGAPDSHPARWAMVELLNVHSPALRVEPIHRWIDGLSSDLLRQAIDEHFHRHPRAPRRTVELISGSEDGRSTVAEHISVEVAVDGVLVLDTVQPIIDRLIAEHGLPAQACEYVHGRDELNRLARTRRGVAVALPAVERSSLFDYVAQRGTMPRKAFSLGDATEKRYYLECRAIREDGGTARS